MLIATATALSRRPRKSWPETALAAGATVSEHAAGVPLFGCSEVAAPRVGFAEVFQSAIEFNRNRASRRDVRLHAYVVDQLVPAELQSGLLSKLDTLVARTILNAVSGSAITCEATVGAGEARVHLSFAKPAAKGACAEMSIVLVDEYWSWRLSNANSRYN